MSDHNCQFCFNSPLRPSRPKGVKDRIMRLFGRRPMRCHTCEKRFYVRFTPSLMAEVAEKK